MAQYPNLEQALKYHFGYDGFRPGQRQIVEQAPKIRDLLVVMPTGGSVFSTASTLKPGLTVVVSPLIALIRPSGSAALTTSGATFLTVV